MVARSFRSRIVSLAVPGQVPSTSVRKRSPGQVGARRRPKAARWAVTVLALWLLAAAASAQTIRDDFYSTNGTVNALVRSGNTLYLGGSFSAVGPPTGAGVPIDAVTGIAVGGFPIVVGQIGAVAPDGAGGRYIGGLFTTVGGLARANLAHILADNTVAAWDPGTNGQVLALTADGGVVYVGGSFTTAGGQTRNRIAAIDGTTGLATAWDPNSDDQVRALAVSGAVVYAGGRFANIGGQPRTRLAALDQGTALATAWNVSAGFDVFALAVSAGTVYVGGAFNSIGGQVRNRIAAVDAATGVVSAWNPNANSQVNALAVSGGTVYAGGFFTSVGGQLRSRIAALDAGSGLATSWNPNASSTVFALVLSGATVYAGGDFLTIGGQSRSRLAAIDTGSGLATGWDPDAYGTVSALAVGGGNVYAGGQFNGLGGVVRNNIAALDVTSGAVTPWDPNANNQILALALDGGVIYAGGGFTGIGGQIRNGIAALDSVSGLATAWDPGASGQVSALAVSPAAVYAGGVFNAVGGQPRNNLAAIDPATGAATGWNPSVDGQVFALLVDRGLVYVGGSFANVGALARNNITAIDAASGIATGWDPNPNGTIRSFDLSCQTLYVAGFFTTIGGQPRNRIAALDVQTGLASAWNPNSNGPLFAVARGGGRVYTAGVISQIGGQTRNRIAALDVQSWLASSWNPNSNGTVRCLALSDAAVFAGGSFTAMGSALPANIASIQTDNTITCPAITLAPSSLPAAIVGTPFSQTIAASGGAAPTCYTPTAGTLPSGLTLDPVTGILSGTPAAPGNSLLTVTATDANGCSGSHSYTLAVFPAGAASTVAANPSGLCISGNHPCVSVPFVFTRGDATPARGVTVSFQLDVSKLALCTPSTPAASIHAGSWLSDFTNTSLQVTDHGGGSYTVDVGLLGSPCGVTTGGALFTADLKSVGSDGTGSITVTGVSPRDCSNLPLPGSPGPVANLLIVNTPLVVLPATLPGGSTGVAYSQTLTGGSGVAPFSFALTAGELPAGLTLSPAGVLSGTPTAPGAFNFTVGMSDANDCPGSRAYTLNIQLVCPSMVVLPVVVPDGSVGTPYSQTITASAGLAPFTAAVTSGTLPPGLTLSSAGLLSGTPTTVGPSVFTIRVNDAAGCSASQSYTMSIFAAPPNSSIAANTAGLCVSTAHPCVTVPFVFTRGEATPARGASVTFQIDPTELSLCTPATPAASIHLGSWLDGFSNTNLQVVSNGGGSYTVDETLLGSPCGVTSGGVLFTVDLKSVGPDGSTTIAVTGTKVRDCGAQPVPALPGAAAALAIMNTPIAILPATLPNGVTGTPYSQALTASAGEAPLSFAVTAGALPTGLTLNAAGLLSGTPTAAGSFAFPVGVTDANGCPGSRACTLAVTCPAISVVPPSLPDATVGLGYDQTVTASAGSAPLVWSVTSGSLPAGLTLEAATGELHGTPTLAGTAIFTLTVGDANGCTGSESYTLNVVTSTTISTVAPNTAGLCLSTAHLCVSVPMVYTRQEATPARALSVTFQLQAAKLALCTPATPALSIHAGSWLAGFDHTNMQVTDNGGGSYTVDQTILGMPCGVTTGGGLFTIDCKAVGSDGAGTITVTQVRARDCDDVTIAAIPGSAGLLTISTAAPTAVSDLASAQVTSDNGPGQTTRITVTWSTGAPGAVSVYRAPFGHYPEYDDAGGAPPAPPAYPPGPPWTLTTLSASGQSDSPPARDFYYYAAFITDECGNVSVASNLSAGSLDYHLGDVSDGLVAGHGNNTVGGEDISLLGANYGITEPDITNRGVGYLDVGPTTDLLPTSRPTTDDRIDFEDLMMFAGNYGVVSGPRLAARPAAAGGAPEEFRVVAPALVAPGQIVAAELWLKGAGRIQGFSAQLGWDASVLEPLAVTPGDWIAGQNGIVLSPGPGIVDAALLGARAPGMSGEGRVATVRFRVRRAGDAAIRLARVTVRDASNQAVDAAAIEQATESLAPTETMLLAPIPNPARGAAALTFSLARAARAQLEIYDVNGRRVRTLVNEPRTPGVYHAAWDGRDEERNDVAPGVYYARLSVPGERFTKRLVFLR